MATTTTEGENDPETPKDGLQDEFKPTSVRSVLDFFLATSQDPTEKAAISELIALLDQNPEVEEDLIKYAFSEYFSQLRDATQPDFAAGGVVLTTPEFSPSHNTAEADLTDERIDRIRANATAELDELKDDSLKRQQAAEAVSTDALADRRTD